MAYWKGITLMTDETVLDAVTRLYFEAGITPPPSYPPPVYEDSLRHTIAKALGIDRLLDEMGESPWACAIQAHVDGLAEFIMETGREQAEAELAGADEALAADHQARDRELL